MPGPWINRRRLRAGLEVACVVSLSIAIPVLVCRAVRPEPPEATPVEAFVDGPAERERLARVNPDWVLIGNSMLNSRIEWRQLSEMSGRKARRVSQGGTQSALWFLFLKNIVIASGAKPEWVTIFFRDTDLSWPDYRIDGQNADLIERLKSGDEPEWNAVFGSKSPAGIPNRVLAALFPADDLNKRARKKLQNVSLDLTDWGGDIGPGVRRTMLNEMFSLERLRADLGGEAAGSRSEAAGAPPPGDLPDPGMYDDAPMVFDPSPSASFLPHMVALAKQHGFNLHFHRIKRRPAPDGSRPDNPLLQKYMADLRSYLESQGCYLTDESGDQTLGLDMYVNGDHISDEASRRYLENFWTRVRPMIGDGPRVPTR